MDTPDHAFWTYAVFHRKDWWTRAVIGSVAPDIPFFLSSAYVFLIYGVSMEIWIQAFESPWIKPVGYFSHSLVIAALGLVTVLYLRKEYFYPYFYGWVLHIFTDILTHFSDAQAVLWPLSDRRFPGLVSYWESQYYSREFNLVNLTLQSLFALYLLFSRIRYAPEPHPTAKGVLFGLLTVYSIAIGLMFFLQGYFSGGILALHLLAGALFLLIAVATYYYKYKKE